MITRRTLFKTIAALAAAAVVPPAFWLSRKAETAPKISHGRAVTHKCRTPNLTEVLLNRCCARFQEKYGQAPDKILISLLNCQDIWPLMTVGKRDWHFKGSTIRINTSTRMSDHFLQAHHPQSNEWHPYFLKWLNGWDPPLSLTEVDQITSDMTRDAARKVAKAEIKEFYNLKGATHA